MPTILVVDDDPLNRLLVASVLGPSGYTVREAADGAAALAAIVEEPPDAVVLDLSMPGTGGVAVVRALRRDLQSAVPVILYTASPPDAAMRDFAAGYGVAAFLPKPSEPHEILRIVGEVLATT